MSIADHFIETDAIQQAAAEALPLLETISKHIPNDYFKDDIVWDNYAQAFIVGDYWFLQAVIEEIPSILKNKKKAVFWQPQVADYTPPMNGEPGDHFERDLGGSHRKVQDAFLHLISEMYKNEMSLYIEQAEHIYDEKQKKSAGEKR